MRLDGGERIGEMVRYYEIDGERRGACIHFKYKNAFESKLNGARKKKMMNWDRKMMIMIQKFDSFH